MHLNQRRPKDVDFELDKIIIQSGTVLSRLVVSSLSGVKNIGAHSQRKHTVTWLFDRVRLYNQYYFK